MFSVVIPLLDKEQYIAAAIESALAQTLPPKEIIVVDDGSTDGGQNIVRSFPSPVIKLIANNPGRNGEAARNAGALAATNKWIAFLDADDSWGPTHLADMAAAMRPDVGFICTRYSHVFATHRRLSHQAKAFNDATGCSLDFLEFIKLWVDTGFCPAHTSACAVRRDVLTEVGLFPHVMRGGDKDTWLRVAKTTRFVYVPKDSVDYLREVPGGITSRGIAHQLPPLVSTVEQMLASATPEERALLRRLINQEIASYARFSFRNGSIPPSAMLSVKLPQGLSTLLTVAVMSAMPRSVRSAIYRFAKR